MSFRNNYLIVLCSTVIFSVEINGTDGSLIPNTTPKNNIEKETEDARNSLKQISMSNNRNCPSSFIMTCISFCHIPGKELADGKFEEYPPGNFTDFIRVVDDYDKVIIISKENYSLSNYDPCAIDWMKSSIIQSFEIYKNGSIHSEEIGQGRLWNPEEYCLIRRKSNGSEYLAKVCKPWIRRGNYKTVCVIIAGYIMLAIFILFTIVPELKNFRGLIFRSYIASYIALYICALGVACTAELRIDYFWFAASDRIARYFGASCAFWLNAMSFDIWRCFRRKSLMNTSNTIERNERHYIWYAIYAWVSPIVLIGSAAAVVKYVPFDVETLAGEIVKQWGSVAIIIITLICNLFFLTSTALDIKRHQRDIRHVINGLNKHYEADKQWFNLYVKLFILMGGHIIVWPIWLAWSTRVMTNVLATFEVLQSILLFVILTWKESVRRSLYDRFYAMWK